MTQNFKADRLVPFPSTPNFFPSYLGFRPFFRFPYLAHNSDFKVSFFSISYQTAYSLYAVRRRFVLEKPVASVNFLFCAKMADGTVDACVCNGCYLKSYFFPQIAKYLQMMLLSATNV